MMVAWLTLGNRTVGAELLRDSVSVSLEHSTIDPVYTHLTNDICYGAIEEIAPDRKTA